MSSDGGRTYPVVNVLASTPDVDKPWLAVGPDPSTPGNNAVWVTYRDGVPGSRQIFIRGASVSGPGTIGAFSAPVQVSDAVGANYAVPTVGPNGEVAVTWQNPSGGEGLVNILVDRDLNGLAGGVAFGADVTATTSTAGGFDGIPATPVAERGTFASPYLAYDRSGGAFNDRLYLAYADETPDESDDFDIFLRTSIDDGAIWSAAVTRRSAAVQRPGWDASGPAPRSSTSQPSS